MERGQILVLATIVVTLILINTVVIIGSSLLFSQNSKYSTSSQQALDLAEAGVDKAVASLNATAGTYNGEQETPLGPGTYSVSITSSSSTTKIVSATGYVPNASKPISHRTVTIQVSKGIGAAFYYGIQAGEGGLAMSNNSQLVGSVYSNGNITMTNGANITGDAFVAGGIQPTPDQQSDCVSPNCQDFIFGTNVNGNSQLDVAQGFQPSSNGVLNKVSVNLKKFGSPSDLTVRILADNLGKPNKSDILASGTLYANLVTSVYGFVDVYFSSPPTLTANTTYWIVIAASSDANNYWAWDEDTTQGYTRGVALWSPNWQANPTPTWNSINGSLGFKTYLGGVATSITGANGVSIGGNAHANTLSDLNITKGAYYQVANNVKAGSLYPGSADPVAQPFPLSDGNIQDWENQAASLGVNTGNITNCPSSLAAGEYAGSITLPSNCTVTVGSPIWVTGNLSMTNSDIVKLNPSYGGSSGVVVVSNFVTINNSNHVQGTGTNGSYEILVSNYDSKDDPYHNAAITFSNGGNTGIVYTNLGIIQIANNNDLTEITGWQLNLSNNVIVTYDQGLANAFFSSGPGGSFSVVKGTYQVQ